MICAFVCLGYQIFFLVYNHIIFKNWKNIHFIWFSCYLWLTHWGLSLGNNSLFLKSKFIVGFRLLLNLLIILLDVVLYVVKDIKLLLNCFLVFHEIRNLRLFVISAKYIFKLSNFSFPFKFEIYLEAREWTSIRWLPVQKHSYFPHFA